MSKQIKFANVVIVTGTAAIDKNIASVATKGKTLDTLIHKTAVSTVYHAREHGDTTLAGALIRAMPKSGRRKALIAWYEDNMPLDGKITDGKEETTMTLTKGRVDSDFTIEEAAATPFWDHTAEKDVRPATLEAAIKAFNNAVKKAVDQGNADASVAAALQAAVGGVIAANDANQDAATAA